MPGQIDLEELMEALKHERTAIAVLNKEDTRQQPQENAGDGDETNVVESSMSPTGGGGHNAEGEEVEGAGGGGGPDVEKEEKAVFSPEEAESMTAYFVESQQAFSLLNVADIQHGEVV